MAKNTARNKEYLPIGGLASFVQGASKLLFGQGNKVLEDGRLAAVQTLSGTGSLRVGMEFVKNFLPGKKVFVSKPTWGNHLGIIRRSGLDLIEYPYFNNATKMLD
jgi:aspartate/tyrosine/aromatic aminotransferase